VVSILCARLSLPSLSLSLPHFFSGPSHADTTLLPRNNSPKALAEAEAQYLAKARRRAARRRNLMEAALEGAERRRDAALDKKLAAEAQVQ
jgi:hypothetical protein